MYIIGAEINPLLKTENQHFYATSGFGYKCHLLQQKSDSVTKQFKNRKKKMFHGMEIIHANSRGSFLAFSNLLHTLECSVPFTTILLSDKQQLRLGHRSCLDTLQQETNKNTYINKSIKPHKS